MGWGAGHKKVSTYGVRGKITYLCMTNSDFGSLGNIYLLCLNQ